MLFSAIAVILLAAACKNEEQKGPEAKKDNAGMMSENKMERNKKVIMANLEAAGRGDIDGMLKDAAAQFTDYGDGSMPPVTNADSLKSFLGMLFHSIEGFKASDIMLIAEGDYVAAYASWSGVFKNDLMGIKAGGQTIRFTDVDIFKLNEEGKITEHRSVQNTGAVLMAAGMMK